MARRDSFWLDGGYCCINERISMWFVHGRILNPMCDGVRDQRGRALFLFDSSQSYIYLLCNRLVCKSICSYVDQSIKNTFCKLGMRQKNPIYPSPLRNDLDHHSKKIVGQISRISKLIN